MLWPLGIFQRPERASVTVPLDSQELILPEVACYRLISLQFRVYIILQVEADPSCSLYPFGFPTLSLSVETVRAVRDTTSVNDQD